MNIPYIDIHTHRQNNPEEVIAIQSLFLQDVGPAITSSFTAAIHPWHVAMFTPDQILQRLENILLQPGLMAIGETGLDKACTSDYQQQKLIFELQIKFAETHDLPLIIHAVRSWNDMIGTLKRVKVPLVIHGYTAGIEITKQLIDIGAYFSFGKSVLTTNPGGRDIVRTIPSSSIFIESDESNINVSVIYDEVSKIRNIPVGEMRFQIYKNFLTLFAENKNLNLRADLEF